MDPPLNLHISPLHEGDSVRISWDVVEGATGYILERLFNQTFEEAEMQGTWESIDYEGLTWAEFEMKNLTWEQFELQPLSYEIFRGPGTEELGYTWTELEDEDLTWLQFEAKNLTWDQIEILMLHRSTMDMIPIGVKKVIYRIAAYNASGTESAFLTSSLLTVTPIFDRENTIQWPVNNGERYWLLIEGENLWDVDRVPLTLQYSTGMLLLEDFITQILGEQTNPGIYPSAYLQIDACLEGEIWFKGTRQVPKGKNWDGCITLIQFVAIGTGIAEATLS